MNMKLIVALLCSCFITNVFADDQVVKEETNPPTAEAAITPEELSPVLTAPNPNTQPTPPLTAPEKPAATQ